ncbi:phosphoserine transaminase [Alloscardovia venturai]|uniref:Phosphoserine aminotransferase n=1 Tax=Alloscardovia venturai TaxID=1769421 RepID=A0ABW2Y879_9BIFI
MLPSDGRFGSGPSKIRQAQLDYLSDAGAQLMGTSHRQAPVRDLVASIQDGIRTLYSVPDDYEIVLGNGGATAFWDIATACLIEKRAAFGSFGSFSAKFAASAASAPFLDAPVVFSGDYGTYKLPEATEGVDTYAWAHNETSTGVLAPVHRIAGADSDALMLVDGTSAAAGTYIDVSEVDAYYFSPQKGFGSDGGLWIAILSPAAIERAARIEKAAGDFVGDSNDSGNDNANTRAQRWIPPFLSLTSAVKNSRKNQTLNTPAIATLILMKNQIDWIISQGGLPWTARHCAQSAEIIYNWAEHSDYCKPFVLDRDARSTVVVTVDLDDNLAAADIIKQARANGIVDIAGYRGLGRNQLRIGVFPSVDTADVQKLTQCIDDIVESLR